MTDILTDEETRQALLTAGVPRRFHPKGRSLREVGGGNTLTEWIKGIQREGADTFMEYDDSQLRYSLFLYGSKSVDAAYLTARGLLLSRISTMVLTVPTLFKFQHRLSDEMRERVASSLVLVVLGYNDEGVSSLGDAEQLYAVQWWLHRLMDEGKVLVFQGSHKPRTEDCWGRSFHRKINSDCTMVELV